MSKRDSVLLLNDILTSIEKIYRYTSAHTFESFKMDDKTIDAVVRNLEIIGEAANHLPIETKERTEDIKWSRIIGLRNRIIHEYFGVNIKIIWKVISDDLEPFRNSILKLKAKL